MTDCYFIKPNTSIILTNRDQRHLAYQLWKMRDVIQNIAMLMLIPRCPVALQWRHNERDGGSNHQHYDCLLNPLFKGQFKENINAPRHWPLWGESTCDRWIPRTKAYIAENVSIWWRHHVSKADAWWKQTCLAYIWGHTFVLKIVFTLVGWRLRNMN